MSRPAANTLCVSIAYYIQRLYRIFSATSTAQSVTASPDRSYANSVDNHAALHVHMHGMSRHAGTCISMVHVRGNRSAMHLVSLFLPSSPGERWV